MPGSLRWCFTVNNPLHWRPVWLPDLMDYLVWEIEHGEQGTEHVQGYIRFKTRRTQTAVKGFLTDRAHVEVARGSEEDNRRYCSKEQGTEGWEGGEAGTYDPTLRQGRRSDLNLATQAVIEGRSLAEICRTYPDAWVKFQTGLRDLHRMTRPEPPLRRSVTTTVLYGPPGVGKTHRVLTQYPNCYIAKSGRDPFGRYCGEEVLVIDEFNPADWKINDMNSYLDVWRTNLDSRYYDKTASWSKVFILSNLPPSEWYQDQPQVLRDALNRRLTYKVEITSINQELLLV